MPSPDSWPSSRGPTRNAHRTVSEQLRRSASGAGQLADNIADTRADFRSTDDAVTNDLDGVRVEVDCAPVPTVRGGDGEDPGTPGPIKTTNAGLGVLTNAENMAPHLPQHLVDGLPGRTPRWTTPASAGCRPTGSRS